MTRAGKVSAYATNAICTRTVFHTFEVAHHVDILKIYGGLTHFSCCHYNCMCLLSTVFFHQLNWSASVWEEAV